MTGGDCSRHSACIVRCVTSLLGPALTWILEGAEPFDPWVAPYDYSGVETPTPHAGGPVNLAVYAVSGRLVKTLVEGVREAGESSRKMVVLHQPGGRRICPLSYSPTVR